MYYHGNLQLAETAACFGMTEHQVDQIRADALGLLQTMLGTEIGLAELPALDTVGTGTDKPLHAISC